MSTEEIKVKEDFKDLVRAIYERYLYGYKSLSALSELKEVDSNASSCLSWDDQPVKSPQRPSTSSILTQSQIFIHVPKKTSPRQIDNGTLEIKSSTIAINDQRVKYVGNENELENICKNLLELDIERNELSDWIEVKKILSTLKNLRFLNLCRNPLHKSFTEETNIDVSDSRREEKEDESETRQEPSRTDQEDKNEKSIKLSLDYFDSDWKLEDECDKYKSLNTLMLNACFIDIRIVERLLERLPNLVELHLTSNKYSNIKFSSGFVHNSLRTLFLNKNNLNDWNEITQVGKCFPNLECLILSENDLANLPESIESFQTTFAKLHTLSLTKLKIDNWQSVNKLREFPSLKNLRIQNIPLLDKLKDDEKFYLIVASLDESLDNLNGGKVTNEEKSSCQRKYIRYFRDLDEKPARYYELESIHGKLDKLVEISLKPRYQVQVRVKFGDKQTMEKVNLKSTVGDLKKNLEKFVGVVSSKFRIYFIDVGSPYGAEELIFMNKTLHSIKVKDGDEFVIDLRQGVRDVRIKWCEQIHTVKVDSRKTIGEFKKSLEKIIGQSSAKFGLYLNTQTTNSTTETDATTTTATAADAATTHCDHSDKSHFVELKLMNKTLQSLNLKDDDLFECILKSDT